MTNFEFTTDEKIDYIYEVLRKQESRYKRNLITKWLLRAFFIILLVIFYFIVYPKINWREIIEKYIAPKMSKIVTPLVWETMKSMTLSWNTDSNLLNMWDLNTNWNLDQAKIDAKKAELLKRLQMIKSQK